MRRAPEYNWAVVMPERKIVVTDPSLLPPHIRPEALRGMGGRPALLESVELNGLMPMQFDAHCDFCRRIIREGETMLHKSLRLRDGTMIGGGMTPTCVACVDKNPEWVLWLTMGV